jgi:RNA polymerase sigma-70 factor, ECF subfamily
MSMAADEGTVTGEKLRFMPIIPPHSTRIRLQRQSFDAAYLDRLRQGDLETERHFAAYFGELVLIKVRARRRPYPLADDVRQETFLRVLRTLRSTGLRDPGSLGAFVNSVCNNVLLELGRAQARHEPPREEVPPLPDLSTPSPEARLITEERKRAVRSVIESLPPKDRQVLRALFLEEREKSEVCRELGVNRDYLRVLVHRAKNEFRLAYLDREPLPSATAGDGRHLARRSAGC